MRAVRKSREAGARAIPLKLEADVERMEQEDVISVPDHKGVREVVLPDHDR